MLCHTFIAVFAVLPMVAFAAPATLTDGGGQCNVGELSCCNQVQKNSESLVGIMSGPAGDMLPLVGMNCSPLSSEGGMASNSCAAQPVCCQKNEMNSMVNAFNCAPMNL